MFSKKYLNIHPVSSMSTLSQHFYTFSDIFYHISWCVLTHCLVEGSSPVDIEALQQLLGDNQGLSLCIAGNTDPLPILLGCLTPVSISEATVALVQQVAHQLGQK